MRQSRLSKSMAARGHGDPVNLLLRTSTNQKVHYHRRLWVFAENGCVRFVNKDDGSFAYKQWTEAAKLAAYYSQLSKAARYPELRDELGKFAFELAKVAKKARAQGDLYDLQNVESRSLTLSNASLNARRLSNSTQDGRCSEPSSDYFRPEDSLRKTRPHPPQVPIDLSDYGGL